MTNWVTIYDCAQITRSTGALPVMAHAEEEVEEMVSIASAFVINIGTLTPDLIESALKAAKKANERGIPVILDAVGAGATRLRTDSTLKILEGSRVSVLKGNAGEIATLAGAGAEVKGVESIVAEGKPEDHGSLLAGKYCCTVAITGPQDVVTDGSRTFRILNGHPRMGEVVGTGCMSSSVIGCFVSVSDDVFTGTVHALSAYGIAGELTVPVSEGPMEFKHKLIDRMAILNRTDMDRMKVIPSE